jgi:hypothetical protein
LIAAADQQMLGLGLELGLGLGAEGWGCKGWGDGELGSWGTNGLARELEN